MDYVTIFDAPNWSAVGISAVQAVALYLLILIGLKLAGRRMFAELDAQDFVVLLLVADAANLGLTHNDGGFWSSVFSVIAVIGTGSILEYVPVLHKLIEGKPVCLYKNGRLNLQRMKRFHIDESELDEAARQYGLDNYKRFVSIILEPDGSLTGVVTGGRPGGKA